MSLAGFADASSIARVGTRGLEKLRVFWGFAIFKCARGGDVCCWMNGKSWVVMDSIDGESSVR